MRRKGEPNSAVLDHLFPHHNVLHEARCTRIAYQPAHSRAAELGAHIRAAAIIKGGTWYLAFRFLDPAAADQFVAEFEGERYDARDRSKGSGWEKWRKKSKAK